MKNIFLFIIGFYKDVLGFTIIMAPFILIFMGFIYLFMEFGSIGGYIPIIIHFMIVGLVAGWGFKENKEVFLWSLIIGLFLGSYLFPNEWDVTSPFMALVGLMAGYGLYKMGLVDLLLRMKKVPFRCLIIYYRCKLKNPSLYLDSGNKTGKEIFITINESGEYLIDSVNQHDLDIIKGKKMSLGAITQHIVSQLAADKSKDKVVMELETNVDYFSVLALMLFLQKNGVNSVGLYFRIYY